MDEDLRREKIDSTAEAQWRRGIFLCVLAVISLLGELDCSFVFADVHR